MKVKVNLSNQTLEYMDSQPYIQGTDTRNKLSVYIEHSSVPQTEGAFNIMIAYALQNGRTTIKMANTGATSETIDDVLYDIFYFTAPKVLTSISGNFVATLILKVNSNTYKVNVLNTVLNAVDFEAFEDALDDVSSEFIETIEAMSTNITDLQANKVDKTSYDVETKISSNDVSLTLNADGDEDNGILAYDETTGNERRRSEVYVGDGSVNLRYRHIHNDNHANDTNTVFEVSENEITTYSEEFVFAKDNGNNTLPYFALKKNLSNVLELYISKGGSYPTLVSSGGNLVIFNDELVSNIVLDSNGNVILNPAGDGKLKVNSTHNVLDDRNIVDGLNSTSTTDVLSANQGKVLNDQITALHNEIGYIVVEDDESGTLTSDQYAEAQKPYCIIYRQDIKALYYKEKENNSSYKFSRIKFNSIEENNIADLYYECIEVTKSNRIYRFYDDHYLETYNKQGIDVQKNNLQSQIDGINAGQNLADIVADLTALNNLDTTKLQSGDKVEVLSDSNHDNVSTVYNWNGTIWQYIGAYGTDSYTKAQMDSALALKQNVINSSHKLSSDLVDDTNATNKFVSAEEKQFWDAKQMALSDTDSIENVIWGDDDPSNIDIHVGVKVKDSYINNLLGLSVVDGCLCVTYVE